MSSPSCLAPGASSLPEAEDARKEVQPTLPAAPCPGEGRRFGWASQEPAALCDFAASAWLLALLSANEVPTDRAEGGQEKAKGWWEIGPITFKKICFLKDPGSEFVHKWIPMKTQ